MSDNNIFNYFQQGLRTIVGATTEAIETLQNSEKRNQAISEFNEEWQKKSQEWVEKGTLTEAEARKIIEQFFQRQTTSTNQSSPQEIPIDSGANPYDEIKKLTEEIVALRGELEKLNSSN